MAKPPRVVSETPEHDMAQVPPPRNLHDTTDIRFVMVKIGEFSTRLDSMEAAIDKLGSSIASAVEKLEATIEKQVSGLKTDVKETASAAEKQLGEVKDDVKQNGKDIAELDKKVSWVKGAAWVLGILGVVVTLILGAILTAVARKLIG